MKTIINVATVTDYSGEQPVAVQSNPVTTIIRSPAPEPVIIRYFYPMPCCCPCCPCCDCGCCNDNC